MTEESPLEVNDRDLHQKIHTAAECQRLAEDLKNAAAIETDSSYRAVLLRLAERWLDRAANVRETRKSLDTGTSWTFGD